MRKLIVSSLVSLDGLCAGSAGDLSVMPFDVGFSDHNADRLRSADTLLLGRRTFEMFRSYWPRIVDDPSQPALEREIARLNTAIEKVVVSDTLGANDLGGWGPARVVRRAMAHAEIASLAKRPGRDILVFGSRTLWNDLLAAGLVDELYLLIGAGVVGDGLRAFEARPPSRLRLLDASALQGSSLARLRYAVER